jgi:branched-chain amino acid transport system ATP-binding protein
VPPAESSTEAAPVLDVSGVSVRFGGVNALSDVSLTVQPGMVTGLIGPNGAGKTTLFNVISGLQAASHGTVRLLDTDMTGMSPHRRARLGLARTFQRLELFGSLSAGENVQVGLDSTANWWNRYGPGRFPRWRRPLAVGGDGSTEQSGVVVEDPDTIVSGASEAATCERLLEQVGLGGCSKQNAAAMSTGLARMVELARALAIRPSLLLLDEPGSGLDEGESNALGELLTNLARSGMAVLLVEHDMELVMRICDHIYVLDFGDIIASGTPDEIRKEPKVQAAYLGNVDVTPSAAPSTEAVASAQTPTTQTEPDPADG